MNAGLFILIWECLTVILGTVAKGLYPTFALEELMILAAVMAPLAIWVTYWVDHNLLMPRSPLVGRLPQVHSGLILDSASPTTKPQDPCPTLTATHGQPIAQTLRS